MISIFKITYFQPWSQKMHNLILTFFGINVHNHILVMTEKCTLVILLSCSCYSTNYDAIVYCSSQSIIINCCSRHWIAIIEFWQVRTKCQQVIPLTDCDLVIRLSKVEEADSTGTIIRPLDLNLPTFSFSLSAAHLSWMPLAYSRASLLFKSSVWLTFAWENVQPIYKHSITQLIF